MARGWIDCRRRQYTSTSSSSSSSPTHTQRRRRADCEQRASNAYIQVGIVPREFYVQVFKCTVQVCCARLAFIFDISLSLSIVLYVARFPIWELSCPHSYTNTSRIPSSSVFTFVMVIDVFAFVSRLRHHSRQWTLLPYREPLARFVRVFFFVFYLCVCAEKKSTLDNGTVHDLVVVVVVVIVIVAGLARSNRHYSFPTTLPTYM